MANYDNLIARLNRYSAEKQAHGGITAEAADAIRTLQLQVEDLLGCCDSCSACAPDGLKKRLVNAIRQGM